ncbi:MAG: transcription termination/antitermination protein NusA [Clostridia bacterium]|nr:transcription termination/antitermination protein NusA [Clostridia bacterium]
MNKDFFAALDALELEKGIPKDYLLEKIEAALVSALRKEYGATALIRVAFDAEKYDLKVYLQKTVVEEVTDPVCEIALEEARLEKKRIGLGEVIEKKIDTKSVRRLSAAAAKSVIIQGIREGERKIAQEAYESKREEIITATVSKIDPENGDVVLETGNGRAVLRKDDQIPGESFTVGDQIKVFVMEVNKEQRGPLVLLSRVHAGLVRRLFELEIPEIAEGIILVKGVSREAGSRTKIAVWSRDENVDAVGACIGSHGVRINNIVAELGGEKIDIIRYSETPEEYVVAALAPASVLSVTMLTERSCRVNVVPDQLSLAIGKEGQNARLAARLTGIKIDIKAE